MTDLTRRQSLGLIGPALLATQLPAVAQSTQPIKIGFGMALSGGLAAGGKAALVAYQIWADEVNQRGGLLGRKVELVHYDDQSNPATVPGIYTKLLDIDKVDLVISGYATAPTAAAMPVIMQRNKLDSLIKNTRRAMQEIGKTLPLEQQQEINGILNKAEEAVDSDSLDFILPAIGQAEEAANMLTASLMMVTE